MDSRKYSTKQAEMMARDFAVYLIGKYHLPVDKVYLYGSYAKNKQRAWSDVDVCIVSSYFRKKDPLSFLWWARRKQDVERMIAPIGIDPKDFYSKTPSPLICEIKQTGRAINLRIH